MLTISGLGLPVGLPFGLFVELTLRLHRMHKQSMSVQRDFCMATIRDTKAPMDEAMTKMTSLGVHSM
jgi:hypothetical protein